MLVAGIGTYMKILIIDDHVLIREALHRVLRELKADVTVDEAATSRQALDRIRSGADYELILLDLTLPDLDGFELMSIIAEHHGLVPIVVLSASNDRDTVARAMDLGAVGFIPKAAPREVMISAFNLIFAGGIYIPPEILRRAPSVPKTSVPMPTKLVSAAELGLTERQMEVLALMMHGKSNKAICRELHLAEPTVKNHVTAILKALKATNRTEAVIAAGALGLARRAPA
jgi:DNA-binding NarL/FixJ family response regulator